jgi:hypothetical protein
MLKNRTTAILDGLFSGSFRPTQRTLLKHCATPQQTHLSDRCTLKEAFCSNCGQKKAEELKAATKASVAVGFGPKTLTFELRLFHEESELVCSQIDEVEFELTRLLDKASGRWLLSVFGIVIALALIIAGEIGALSASMVPISSWPMLAWTLPKVSPVKV